MENRRPVVAAVVVTYNRKEMLRENIDCLLAQKPAPPSVLVIDNHSSDGTKEYIQQYIDRRQVEYYDTGSNLGGAGGFSFGIRRAAEQGCDFIWVMDDDCMPAETALEEFLRADREIPHPYGFLSGKVLWKDGSLCRMNLQRDTLTHTLSELGENIRPVVMASFVSLFLPAEIVREMGLPIKEFFIWTDDWEYTRRISRKYPCYAVPRSVAVHKSRANTGADISSESADRLDRFDYLYRNDVYLYRREGLRGFLYEAARLSGHCVRVILKSPDSRMKRLKKIFSGTRNGLRFHPQIEYAEQNREGSGA